MADFEYDVFLSHNSKDKPNVERLAERLEDEAGITVFLDKWNLVPGDPWQEELERALECSRAVAVFLGPSGISSWHNEEMRSAIDRRTHNKEHRVIPVLLPDTELPEKHQIPLFLGRLTWVDFRKGMDDSDAFNNLVAGIKGTPPGRRNKAEKIVPDVKSTNKIRDSISNSIEDLQKESSSSPDLVHPRLLKPTISSSLYHQLRSGLLNCAPLDSDREIRAIFIHPDLIPWRNSLPQGNNINERADLLLDYLLRQHHSDGRNVLTIFIQVLRKRADPATECYNELVKLEKDLLGES